MTLSNLLALARETLEDLAIIIKLIKVCDKIIGNFIEIINIDFSLIASQRFFFSLFSLYTQKKLEHARKLPAN